MDHRHVQRRAQELLAAMPEALRLLRKRAGHESLRPAAEANRQRTGTSVSKATLSEWERGTRPVLDSLVFFLVGLGYTFHDFQLAIDEVLSDRRAAEDDGQALIAQLREDDDLRLRLRDLMHATSADPDDPPERLRNVIAFLDSLGDRTGDADD